MKEPPHLCPKSSEGHPGAQEVAVMRTNEPIDNLSTGWLVLQALTMCFIEHFLAQANSFLDLCRAMPPIWSSTRHVTDKKKVYRKSLIIKLPHIFGCKCLFMKMFFIGITWEEKGKKTFSLGLTQFCLEELIKYLFFCSQ